MVSSFNQLIYFFIIYSFLGWIIEIIYTFFKRKKFINRGFLFGPFCPIYGFGIIFLINLLQPFFSQPLLIFIGTIIITSTIEYSTGFILDKIFHTHWWNYSQEPFNLNGYICLRFSLYWGIFGTLFLYFIHPYIQNLVIKLDLNNFWWLPNLIIIYLLIDFGFTLKSLIKIKAIYKNFNKVKKHYLNIRQEFYQHNLNLLDFKNVKKDFSKNRKMLRRKIKKFHLVKAFPNLYLINKLKK